MKPAIKSIIVFYKILFYALTPIIITMSPAIPYTITNNGAYMFGLFITLPLGAALAMKFWEFTNLEDKQPTNQQPTNQQPTPTEESKSINQIKI